MILTHYKTLQLLSLLILLHYLYPLILLLLLLLLSLLHLTNLKPKTTMPTECSNGPQVILLCLPHQAKESTAEESYLLPTRAQHSEALSSTNETGISQSLRSISPLTALAAGSPSNAIGAGLHKKPSPDDNTSNEKQATTTNEMMDCGNLDLLASVTQNVDQVNRISNMEPVVVGVQRSDEHSVLSPFPSLSVSSSIKTSTTTSTASTTTTIQ